MSFRWSPLSANREGVGGQGVGGQGVGSDGGGGGAAAVFSHVDYSKTDAEPLFCFFSPFVRGDGCRFPDVCKTYCLTYCMLSDVLITKQEYMNISCSNAAVLLPMSYVRSRFLLLSVSLHSEQMTDILLHA